MSVSKGYRPFTNLSCTNGTDMSIFSKGRKAYSIFFFKCPHCHEGRLFINPNPYALRQLYEMPEACEECGQDFQLEPGFYWGGMYISYVIAAFILFGTFAILLFGLGVEFRMAEIITVVIVLVLWPVLFRLSRSIWINVFVHYQGKAPW